MEVKDKTYSELFYELTEEIKKGLKNDKRSLTALVQKGVSISTAINLSSTKTTDYRRFIAINVYKLCVYLDEIVDTKYYTKTFKQIFDENYVLLNRWYKRLKDEPDISAYVLGAYRNKRYMHNKRYRYTIDIMLKILDKAQELERNEKKQ